MRGNDEQTGHLFSYLAPDERVPAFEGPGVDGSKFAVAVAPNVTFTITGAGPNLGASVVT